MRRSILTCSLLSMAACSSPPPADAGTGIADAGGDVRSDIALDLLSYDVIPVDEGPADAPSGPTFCSLAATPVAGAEVPNGFCIRRFAAVPTPRTLAFAPNGDLFVASPFGSTQKGSFPGTFGGAQAGAAAIMVLADDDHDGVAESHTFLRDVRDVHGIAVGGGFLYFTTEDTVWRTPYSPGQRAESGTREPVGTFDTVTAQRWTHGMARTAGGTVYVSQGVHTASICPDTERAGSIQRVATGMPLQLVAAGLRNPLYMRCHYRDEVCLAAELGDDGGSSFGAREKVILVRPETSYGFPCCTTMGEPTPSNGGRFNCSAATREEAMFPLNDTPFGLDWERSRWPLPFRDGVFFALHGSFYAAWAGARIVFAATDPSTHAPAGPFMDFVRGFAPDNGALKRPSDLAFGPDGRMFFADDHGGAVYWVAPDTLRMDAR